jgi:glycosyltransferase involved in cell wall biosynthesis
MYIRRDCLRNVGLFDAEHFGKGYGEENDFSVRAATAGWRNVLCADTYVLHVGSVSFQADKKPGVQRAMQTLRKLHPDYEPAVLQFVSQDPIRPLRLAIDLARLAERRLPRILVVTHDRLGGTQKHIDDLAELFTSEIDFLLLRPAPNGSVTLSWLRKDEPLCLTFNVDKNFEQLLQVLRMIGISRVHFHHLLAQHPRIWGIATDLDVEYDFSVHDYYSMCPQISLTGRDNKYCGEKGVSDCGRCLADQPAPGDVDIQTWRSNYERLLHHASRVFAPSAYVADRIRRYFPEARVHAVPHPETDKVLRAAPPTPRVSTVGRALKIGVLGALSPVKGPDLLEACAIDAKRRGLPLQFDLFGYAYRHLLSAPKSALTVYGQYEPDQLQALFDHYQPDLIWFPAQWPETYSYTLSEAIASSMPVVCPDIGAFPERIVGREWSWVCEWDKDAKQINDFFMRIKTEHFDRNSPPSPYAAQFELPSFEYRRDYLKSCSAPASKIFDAAGVHGFVAEYRATHATMVTAIATPVRLKALAILVKLRGAPVMRWVSRSMPMAWQRKVKNLLLGHRN